ncbi:hypothetical protein FQN52_002821 [Onygenales sp. PD_12]|nr:hypothetical protein FQN52_002821 [Onygenales sp. PD_12]
MSPPLSRPLSAAAAAAATADRNTPPDTNNTTTTPPASQTTTNPLLRENPLLTPLEQEVLDEYARLLGNMNTVGLSPPPNLLDLIQNPFNEARWKKQLSSSLAHLSTRPAAETLDALRLLERKTATVCTLLKASVYSIVLQQGIFGAEGGEREREGERGEEGGY